MGDFIVTGWYKIGIIDNKSIVSGTNNDTSNKNNKTSTDSEIKFDSGELNFHPCFTNSTNCNPINSNQHIENQLDNKKFHSSILNT